jgi:hypothetical protein
VGQGGKLTNEDLAALKKAGVEFTPKELSKIEHKLGLEHVSCFPPGTKVSDVMDMVEAGVDVDARDLISLKAADGVTPAFIDIKDLIKMKEKGGTVTGADLIDFQKSGGNFNGDHLVDFVNAGGKVSAKELTTLAEGGMQIYQDDFKSIVGKLHLKIDTEQYMAIKPVKVSNDTDHVDDYSTGFTM